MICKDPREGINVDDQKFYLATKFLFMPRYITAWDLNFIMKSLKIESNELMNESLARKKFENPVDNLLFLTLLRIKQITERKDNKNIVTKKNLEIWLSRVKKIIKLYIDLGRMDIAKALIFNLVSVIYFIFTLYISWMGLVPKGISKLFGKGEVKEDAIKYLINLPNDAELREILKAANFEIYFDFTVSCYAISLDSIIKKNEKNKEKQEKIKELFKPILGRAEEFSSKFEEVIELTKQDPIGIEILDLFLPFAIEALSKESLKDQVSKEKLDNILKNLKKANVDSLKMKSFDATKLIVAKLTKLIPLLFDGEIDSAVELLKSLGKELIEMRIRSTAISDKIFLRAPPELNAMRILSTPPSLNVIDDFAPSELLLLFNEGIDLLTGWSFEAKMLINSIFMAYNREFFRLLNKAIEDSRSSMFFYLMYGSPIALIIDQIINLATFYEEDKKYENALVEYLQQALAFIDKNLEIIKKNIDRTKLKSNEINKIWGFLAYRNAYFAGVKLTVEIRRTLLKFDIGKKVIQKIEEYSKIAEEIFGKIERKISTEEAFSYL